ncbi:ankyrin repeat and SAM domain-containing protein 6-like [Sycon ciliatum]|uniref:ankyrin repeat and SAM domain-containing protein 6-like n=1 Tax=Sycon ciliatum TaxID=27933 RepID=UPI0020A92139|eukprot:scpid27064/ scgid15049/ Ankyrin repeat and SAM domain-containing protein 6; Polycystic kidney disease protein 1; SamCystin; Sterile alpha motif domain-containing protein 6
MDSNRERIATSTEMFQPAFPTSGHAYGSALPAHSQPLWSPASSIQTVSLTALMDHGHASVSAQDQGGNTALAVAASAGHEQAVRSLLKRGAAVNARNSLGTTALIEACRQGNANITKLLLQNKADPSAQNAVGAGPLSIASSSGHAEIVRMLIDSGADVEGKSTHGEGTANSSRRNASSVCPLIMACYGGHKAVVDLLLHRGAEVDCKLGDTGWTPLMAAAACGHADVCQLLLQRGGADAEVTNICDCNALDLAILTGHSKVQKLLERHTRRHQGEGLEGDARRNIFDAAKEGDLQLLQHIVSKSRQQASTCDADGATPLMFAAIRGHIQVVEALVKAGANVNAQDLISCWTSLMQATYYGHTVVAEYLVENGADVNLKARDGSTAFEIAQIVGDTFLIRLLAKHSLKPVKKDAEQASLAGGNSKKRALFSKQWSRTSQTSTQSSLSGTNEVGSADPLPAYIGSAHNGSPHSFKKWFLNFSSKLKKATSSKVADGSSMMEAAGSSRPLSPSTSAAQAHQRRNPPQQHRQLQLPWGNHEHGGAQSIPADKSSPHAAPIGGAANRTPEFPPSFGVDDEGKGSADLLVTDLVGPPHTGRLPADMHTPIVPPLRPSAAFSHGYRHGSTGDGHAPHAAAASVSPPLKHSASPEKKSLVKRGVSSTSLNSSGGSMSRQTSMVRPSRRSSTSGIGTTTGNSSSVASPLPPQNPSSPAPRTAAGPSNSQAHRHLTVQLVQERNRQAEVAAASKSPAQADLFSPAANAKQTSLDFLPQPKQQQQQRTNVKSRYGAQPSSPVSAGGTGGPVTPALSPSSWTSQGQQRFNFGYSPAAGISHHRQGSASATSQGSSEGTGSTISVERQRNAADDELGQLLRRLNLNKHRRIFQDQEVDVETFVMLTDTDLRELGIQSGHDRKQILRGIAQLNK